MGYEPKSPCRDNFLSDSDDVLEEELLTELLFPIEIMKI